MKMPNELLKEIIGSRPKNADDVSNEPKPFRIWRASDFAKHTTDPDDDVLGEALLRAGNLTVLIGQGNVGKSTWSLALASAQITRQTAFCGLELATMTQRWLFLGTENGADRWKADFASVLQKMDSEDCQRIEENLMIAALFDEAESDPSLTLPESAGRLTATIQATGADIVVLDPWNDLTSDEIDSNVVRSTIYSLRAAVRAANPRCAILVLAHARTGKEALGAAGGNFDGPNSQRGNRMLTNSARCVLGLYPREDSASEKLVLMCVKLNDAAKFSPIAIDFSRSRFDYHVEADWCVEDWRSDVKASNSSKGSIRAKCSSEDVVEVIRSGVSRTGAIVAELEGKASARSVKEALACAVAEGKILRVTAGVYTLRGIPLEASIK